MKENLSSSSVWSSIGQKLHKNKKNLISVLLFLLLAALTFSAICKGNDMTEVAKAVRKMDAWYLFGAMGLGIFFVSAEGLMICYLLRALGNPIAAGRCIKYSFIGFFYSGITPSATGGQPMQLYHMKKDGLKISESTVVLMTVAVLYKFVLVVIGIFMLLFGYHPLKNYLGSYMWLFYLGLLLNTVLVIFLLIVMFGPKLFNNIVTGVERFCVRFHLLKHSEERIEKLSGFAEKYRETVQFFAGHKGKIVAVTLFTVLQRCSVFFLTYLVYLGFHLKGTDALTVMMLQASVYIAVDMLPLPGAQGITELMYKSIFVGVFRGTYLTASMCVSRGINFYFLLITSAILTVIVYILERKCSRKKPAETAEYN